MTHPPSVAITEDSRPPEVSNNSIPAPTRVRYGVLAFLCTLALLLYIDRVCIGQAADSIEKEFGLSKSQMGWIFNAFTLAYCLFEVPTGHWGDRYGSRGVIARIAICWSIFTALTGAAFGFGSLVAIRFLFGAGEAGAFPNTARVVTRWFPPGHRGFARGSVTFVSLIGAAVAPPLAAWLIQHVGWRETFATFGIAGVAWAAGFYWWFRDSPAEHSSVNAAERALIGVEAVLLEPATDGIPWRRVLRSPNLWLMGAIMGVNGILFYMQFQWYPTYLKEARGQTEMSSGWLTGTVMAGGAIGCVAGGLLSDFVMRRTRERKWTHRLCGGGALLCAALSMFAVNYVNSAVAVTLCNASALFFIQVSIPTWWSAVAHISGRHGAAMWGLMNSLGGLALMATTSLVARFVEHRHATGHTPIECWSGVFIGVACATAGGAICWMLVDVNRSIVEGACQAEGE